MAAENQQTTVSEQPRTIANATVTDLAENNAVEAVFAMAVDEGASDALVTDLRSALSEMSFDVDASASHLDLRDLLIEGRGYMRARVEEAHRDLDRIEYNIVALQQLVEERREERDGVYDEYDRLKKLTGYAPHKKTGEED